MSKRRFAAFDIDGTLIRWQLYHAVVDRLAKKGLLGLDAQKELNAARMHWKRREHPNAFRDYELELIKIYETALPTLTADQFDEAVKEIAGEYKTQIYTYTRDLINTLRKKDYLLIAISGSHQELVEHVAKQYGFEVWIGSQYERLNGKFTGKKIVGSHNKRLTLQEIIGNNNLSLSESYAIGDSKSDADMLDLAEHPVAFNPDQDLLDISISKGWLIVIERKNVIYRLENQDGRYILA